MSNVTPVLLHVIDPTTGKPRPAKATDLLTNGGGGTTSIYSGYLGDGVVNSFDVYHGLTTFLPTVTIFNVSDRGIIFFDYPIILSANEIRINLGFVPGFNELRIFIK